jgi:hypothetical protein
LLVLAVMNRENWRLILLCEQDERTVRLNNHVSLESYLLNEALDDFAKVLPEYLLLSFELSPAVGLLLLKDLL